MASNINTTDIDETYPIAGQDNDSQGFRDNFSTIKDNFVAAKAEIETLQDDTAKLNDDNDFNYNKLTHGVLLANVEDTFNIGSWNTGTLQVDFSKGHYQTVQIANPTVTISFTGWPNFSSISGGGVLCKIRLVISGDGTSRSVSFGGDTIRKNFSTSLTVQSTTEPRVVDVWTDDGQVIYIQDHGAFN